MCGQHNVKTTQDRTQKKNTHPIPGQKLKFLTPPGMEPGPPRRVGRQVLYRPRHSSFSNPSVASPMSQLILQPFRRFTFVTAHSPILPLLHLRHRSFSNPSVALPTSQLIIQPFPCFTYVTVYSPTLPLLYLRHSSFSNTSVASPTSQFILQPFFRFSYITSSSLNSPGEPPMYSGLNA